MTVQARKLTGKSDDNIKSDQLSSTTEFMTAAGGNSTVYHRKDLKGSGYKFVVASHFNLRELIKEQSISFKSYLFLEGFCHTEK